MGLLAPLYHHYTPYSECHGIPARRPYLGRLGVPTTLLLTPFSNGRVRFLLPLGSYALAQSVFTRSLAATLAITKASLVNIDKYCHHSAFLLTDTSLRLNRPSRVRDLIGRIYGEIGESSLVARTLDSPVRAHPEVFKLAYHLLIVTQAAPVIPGLSDARHFDHFVPTRSAKSTLLTRIWTISR